MAMLGILLVAFIFSVTGIAAEYLSERKERGSRRRKVVFISNVAVALSTMVAGGLQLREQAQDRKAALEQEAQRAGYEARIETLQTETRDLVTGGKSYVWIHAAKYPFTKDDKNLFLISAVHAGDRVSAFDVNIEFETTGQCDGFLSPNPGRGPRDLRRVYFPAITSKVPAYPIQSFLNPTCDEAFYVAAIHTRNRFLSQQTILKKTEGSWKVFARVVDVETGVILHAYPTLEAVKRQRWATDFPSGEDIRRLRKSLSAGEVVGAAK